MKLFLSTSFSSGKLNAEGAVIKEYREELEMILEYLRHAGFEVFSAVEQMDWTISHNPPETKTAEYLAEVEKADLVLALLGDIISAGVQLEIGYAIAKAKRIILATPVGTKLPYVNQGVVNLGLASHVGFMDSKSLAVQVGSQSGMEVEGWELPGGVQVATHTRQEIIAARPVGVGSAIAAPTRPPMGDGSSVPTALTVRGIVAPPVHPPSPVTRWSQLINNSDRPEDLPPELQPLTQPYMSEPLMVPVIPSSKSGDIEELIPEPGPVVPTSQASIRPISQPPEVESIALPPGNVWPPPPL